MSARMNEEDLSDFVKGASAPKTVLKNQCLSHGYVNRGSGPRRRAPEGGGRRGRGRHEVALGGVSVEFASVMHCNTTAALYPSIFTISPFELSLAQLCRASTAH